MELPQCRFIGSVVTQHRGHYDWHTHGFEELCLVLASGTTMGHAGREVPARPGEVYWFRKGERHGYWNGKTEAPRLLVLCFSLSGQDCESWVRGMRQAASGRRVWSLSRESLQQYRRLFYQGLLWRSSMAPEARTLLNLLPLQLLALLRSGRWKVDAAAISDEDLHVMRWLEERLACGELSPALADLPNYDSLRHTFAARHGVTPVQLLRRMRMQQAQLLLLQTAQSIKEIAHELGYQRQHEFSRAFRRHFGVSPNQWRRSPE